MVVGSAYEGAPVCLSRPSLPCSFPIRPSSRWGRNVKLVLGLLLCAPAFATLQISSASLAADGFTITATMNGNTLTGSTSGCFSISGGTAAANGATPVSAVLGGANTITIVWSIPLYGEQSPVLSMVAAPTCLIVGSTGAAAASTATMATGTGANSSEWHGAHNSTVSSHAAYDGSPAFGDQFGLGYADMTTWNSADGSITVANTGTSSVHIWAWHGSNAWCIQQDGADAGTRQTSDASSVFSEFTLVKWAQRNSHTRYPASLAVPAALHSRTSCSRR